MLCFVAIVFQIARAHVASYVWRLDSRTVVLRSLLHGCQRVRLAVVIVVIVVAVGFEALGKCRVLNDLWRVDATATTAQIGARVGRRRVLLLLRQLVVGFVHARFAIRCRPAGGGDATILLFVTPPQRVKHLIIFVVIRVVCGKKRHDCRERKLEPTIRTSAGRRTGHHTATCAAGFVVSFVTAIGAPLAGCSLA